PPAPGWRRAVRRFAPELARRLIVSPQPLAGPAPVAPGPEAIMGVATDLASLQLDPISVVARSHQLVLWSRLGRYHLADLDALLWRDRCLFEYWAHAAAIVCTGDYPIHSLLMRRSPKARHGQPGDC